MSDKDFAAGDLLIAPGVVSPSMQLVEAQPQHAPVLGKVDEPTHEIRSTRVRRQERRHRQLGVQAWTRSPIGAGPRARPNRRSEASDSTREDGGATSGGPRPPRARRDRYPRFSPPSPARRAQCSGPWLEHPAEGGPNCGAMHTSAARAERNIVRAARSRAASARNTVAASPGTSPPPHALAAMR